LNDSRRRFIQGSLAAAGAVASRATPAAALGKRKKNGPLFEDDFDRKDRAGWGGDWFNQRYDRHWHIHSKRGIFRFPATENKTHYRPTPVLVLDHDVTDIDLRTTLSVSNPTARAGLAARAIGYSDFYVAYLAPKGVLQLSRCDHHDERRLAKQKIRFSADRRYRLRVQVRGTGPVRIRAKVWPLGTPEPRAWTVEAIDAATDAIVTKGAFGLFFQTPTDRRSCAIRVVDLVARSEEKPSSTSPSISYALAGPPHGNSARLVAMTAVPSYIGFEVATEPTFTEGAVAVPRKHTNRALTARASIDLAPFGQSGIVYWRAIAERGGTRVVGPTSSFRTGPAAGLPVRFAFGSCTRWQQSPRRSFDQARLKLADFYLHQGDFGYVPTKVVAHAADTYQDHWARMLMDPSFSAMTRELPVSLMRDDADYGRNRADRKTLRRFTIGAHDQLNANPGPYFETRFGDVAVFSIDCRRFSTGKEVPVKSRSKLGARQKQWLKDSMRKAVEDEMALLVLSSPQAFGSDVNIESWRGGYLQEWTELVDFFQRLETPVLIVSGDAHGHRLHEYPQKNLQTDVPRIVEIVSSGTEQNRFFDGVDPQFILRKAKGSGFGLVELGAEQHTGGQRTRTLTLTAVKTSDGSPFWTASYLIVRGVGLLPIVGA
jgi:hypothetical protein